MFEILSNKSYSFQSLVFFKIKVSAKTTECRDLSFISLMGISLVASITEKLLIKSLSSLSTWSWSISFLYIGLSNIGYIATLSFTSLTESIFIWVISQLDILSLGNGGGRAY